MLSGTHNTPTAFSGRILDAMGGSVPAVVRSKAQREGPGRPARTPCALPSEAGRSSLPPRCLAQKVSHRRLTLSKAPRYAGPPLPPTPTPPASPPGNGPDRTSLKPDLQGQGAGDPQKPADLSHSGDRAVSPQAARGPAAHSRQSMLSPPCAIHPRALHRRPRPALPGTSETCQPRSPLGATLVLLAAWRQWERGSAGAPCTRAGLVCSSGALSGPRFPATAQPASGSG